MKIDSNNYRQFSIFILALIVVSVLINQAFYGLLKSLGITIPTYIEAPSVMGVFGVIFWFFDNHLWKIPIFKQVGIVIADDLSGIWEGKVKSSYDKFKKDIYAKLTIEQTATRVKIFGQFNESKSVSVHENFSKSEIDNKIALFYFYRNEPKYDAKQTMAKHEGSTKLTYDKTSETLTGYYYSGRDRNNYGTIEVKRIKK